MKLALPRLYAFVRSRFSREGAVGLYFTAGFLVCALLVAFFGLLATLIFDELRLESLDRWATLAARQHHSPGLDGLALAVTYFGGHAFLLPATLAVCGILAIRGRRVSAILFAASVAGGMVLNMLLKLSFARARPDLWEPLVTEWTYSFPSGHALASLSVYGILAWLVTQRLHSKRLNAAIWVFAILLVFLIGFSRVYFGVHHASDVIAGYLAAFIWTAAVASGDHQSSRRTSNAVIREMSPND